MQHFAQPIRHFFTESASYFCAQCVDCQRNQSGSITYNQLKQDSCSRMSELSFGSAQTQSSSISKMNYTMDECNELDFKQFVSDLSSPQVQIQNECSNCIYYKREGHKETIIMESTPNKSSTQPLHVVKLNITPCNAADCQLQNSTSTINRCALKKSNPNLPVMGRTALIQKLNASTPSQRENDEVIVKELVTQRFQNALSSYYERSFHRQSSRIQRSSKSLDKSDKNFDISSIKSQDCNKDSSIDSGTAQNYNHYSSSPTISRKNSGNNLKFLLSTDLDNIETSPEGSRLPYSTTSSINDKFSSGKSEECEYDATAFLKEALGDEMHNCSTDASFAINHSVGTSNISALISANGTLENSKIPLYENSTLASEYDYYSYNSKIGRLLTQMEVQQQIIMQTSKALMFCKNTREFSSSPEELEAERILLIATCRQEAIRNEINRLEYEDVDYGGNNYGCIKINQMVLPAKQRNPLFSKKKKKDFTDWYICILTSGAEVYSTNATRPDDDGFVRFQDEFVFDFLHADFAIHAAFYSLKLRQTLRPLSHESKFHLHRNSTTCPFSPPKLFGGQKQYKSIKLTHDVVQQSAYQLSGEFTLKLSNIGHLGHFKLSSLTLPSLEGNLIMDFVTFVRLNEDYSGFLNIGQEIGESLIWNRRWCTLTGALLNYFNYPGEENPLGFIDLHFCAAGTIASADREICARPRTLLVEVYSTETRISNNVIKYFLGADSKQYLEMWEHKLNNTVTALRVWGVIKNAHIFNR